MPTPTRTSVAVAVVFVVFAAYGAGVITLVTSMYGEFVAMPNAVYAAALAILFSVIGLVHLAWTRCVPWHTFCLFLLLLEMVCVSVLLAYAIESAPMLTNAIDAAPELTTYQHRMEAFLSSDEARKVDTQDILVWGSWYLPRHPVSTYNRSEYPRDAAQIFSEAYCVSEGYRFCSAFPLVQTILYHGVLSRPISGAPEIWATPNMTAQVERNLSTLPATLANVTVTATTTIESFCARVKFTGAFPLYYASFEPMEIFMTDLYHLCHGCAALSTDTTKHDALKTWIRGTCPMTTPKRYGIYCIKRANLVAKNNLQFPNASAAYPDTFAQSYLNPSYDACFGHTLMSVARNYDIAMAVVSSIVLLISLLLFARVCVVRNVEHVRDARRQAAIAMETPANHV